MRIGPAFSLSLFLATGLYAQGRVNQSVVNPAGGVGTPGITRTFGSVVNPASGGGIIPGNWGFGNFGFGRGNFGRGNRGGLYAYPIYIGGYGGSYISGYGDSSESAPPPAPPPSNNVIVVVPQQSQSAPPVVVNNNYGVPMPPNAVMGGPPQPSEEEDAGSAPAHYLIALKDHTIFAATAYWVDGDTLHYFTAGNVHNQASLTLVDREFTKRLNKEQGLDVNIPAPAK
jgi:hypothetical protein